MRRMIVTVVAGLTLALAAFTGVAAADHDPLGDDGCPPLDASFCVQDEEPGGNSISFPTAATLVAVFWVTPLVLAAVFASRNDENVGNAVLLTMFLGWIGLYVVYRGQRRSAEALMQAAEPRRGRS